MTAKIQIFESNSQRSVVYRAGKECCLWPQRYKFLKAIHNDQFGGNDQCIVVYDRKDTNFWKQFTTSISIGYNFCMLFMTAKIQIFESNSQQYWSITN